MNKQERTYFDAITKDRSEIADVLERRAAKGFKDSVVEKYSDQAHFIYELLQNADDAGASNARFILDKDKLVFAHDGTRHFSVSDPNNEENDSNNGVLGDINAITSIANSNKTGASIGKFGVGFKAVFQYTSTPEIYDPNISFKIERFIVPVLLDFDFHGRQKDETLFVFPFNHPKRDASEAYNDISKKLKSLTYPLLFLSNLKNIEFEIGNCIGLYGKKIMKSYTFGNVYAEHICLTQNDGEDLYDKKLWAFSRLDEFQRRYSVGFFTSEKDKLQPENIPAFCFFPTKEITGLNFILHAPFLLTDSREGIRAGVEYNENLIQLLADLAADAIACFKKIGEKESIRLLDDSIVSIIPTDPNVFTDPKDKSRVSFLPFYNAIKDKFRKTALIPTINGYVESENAYWASVPQIAKLFSNKQLALITENSNAQWAFVTLGRDELSRTKKDLYNYIDSLVRMGVNEDAILSGRTKEFYYDRISGTRQPLGNVKGITAKFIESQSIEWLNSFYKWLSETKHRTDIAKTKPIFIDQHGKAVAGYDNKNELILFMPVEGFIGYTVVNSDLLKNADTRKFLEGIGIKQPSLKNQIYNIILPQYEDEGEIDTEPHFRLFFEYYCKCPSEEVDNYIDLIKDCAFINYYVDGEEYRGAANSMYLPTPEIKTFFETKKGVKFVAFEEYKNLVGAKKENQLISFFSELQMKKEIEVVTEEIDPYCGRADLPDPNSTREKSYEENIVDGCKEIVEDIVSNHDKAKSVLLWNCLLRIIESNYDYRCLSTLSSVLSGKCYFYYYSPKCETFESSDAILLKNSEWIVNADGEFVLPSSINLKSLSNIYDTSSEYVDDLISFLNFRDDIEQINEFEDNSNLTDEQREKIAFVDKLKEYGIKDETDLAEFKEYKREKEAKKHSEEDCFFQNSYTLANRESNDGDESKDIENDKTYTTNLENKLSKVKSSVVKDIVSRTMDEPTASITEQSSESDDIDEDEYMHSTVDYTKKIERAKQNSAAEIDKIAYLEELQKKAMKAKRYSFGWFKALLELELLNSGQESENSKEVSISFAKVEREEGTKRTLVLKYPNRYIPQFMEDLADIPLVLHMGDEIKNVAIEVASIKSYTLHVKMKNCADIDGVDLSRVTAATIDAKSPSFLLEELRKQFSGLGYNDDFDMQQNLCENIEFVFGPPGTGKTTHLAKNVLIPLMKKHSKCKVLVLTPTNKSADVLVRRIMEVSGDNSYNDWLVRFGATSDDMIEQSEVFKDKTFDIRTLPKNVTVTTIARFPYDFFMPNGARIFLQNIEWDYIVIDEASMIPVVNIVYPLYKKTPNKFIVAGDPFQIEPITSIDLWKNENIYTLVHLNSFTNPHTIPYQYKIELLTTQYRSIPDIGSVFSELIYGGILKHYRTPESQKPLNVEENLQINTLNIIKFPVSKYESIYRCKRLQHSSSYQVYSALFTFEYVCYLSRAIAKSNPGTKFKIGVIAPYRAQADMIDKLMASENLPEQVDVEVGTIHGFQGDECDIIFAVLNTPPTISSSKDMFLNKKNIINVCISRARDYLFIVIPDDNTENITNLSLVKRVEQLMKDTNSCNEFVSPDLESLMFGDSKYLENNTFSTSHQRVNVYGLPEKYYEVRTEDAAVDFQIHKNASKIISGDKQQYQVDVDKDKPKIKDACVEGIKSNKDLNFNVGRQDNVKENPVPQELQSMATTVKVIGARAGTFYLVPYKGKLKTFTTKKVVGMFIPQMHRGKEKLVPVSVVKDDHIIYITKENFKMYEKELTNCLGFELRKNYFE